MYEEIDLRKYVIILLQYWKWIAGATVGAGILALIVSFALPKVYKATALVTITSPRYVLQFDPRFEATEKDTPVYRAYPELAESDGIMEILYDDVKETVEIESLRDLQRIAEAESGADASLIRLHIQHSSPSEAAYLANTWATIFARRTNALYGSGSEEELAFFAAQASQAHKGLRAAEEALIEFQSQNRITVLRNQLEAYTTSQQRYLDNQQMIEDLLRDANGLLRQFEAQSASKDVLLAEQLTTLLLQIRAFNANQEAPFQVDVTNTLTPSTVAEQREFLRRLIETLEERKNTIDSLLTALEPQMLDLQSQLSMAQTELDRLTSARNLASETYLTLARKHEEVRIAANSLENEIKIASQASAPLKPVSPRKKLITLAAAAMGFFLSTLGVLVWTSWQMEEQPDTH